jgi:hypothetical protein
MSVNLGKKLQAFGADITFKRLAVNLQQIEEWKLPTRETKRTDTRCREFFDIFGVNAPSVELDAIHPNKLRQIVREAIEKHIPEGHMETIEMIEVRERKRLSTMAKRVLR